jgi:hypothetical protein
VLPTHPNLDPQPPGANLLCRRAPAPDLREVTFCHDGERKSPRVTEEGPTSTPKTPSETIAATSAHLPRRSSRPPKPRSGIRPPPGARAGGSAGREDEGGAPAPEPARGTPLRRHRGGAWEKQRSFFESRSCITTRRGYRFYDLGCFNY